MIAYEIKLRYIIRDKIQDKIQSETKFSQNQKSKNSKTKSKNQKSKTKYKNQISKTNPRQSPKIKINQGQILDKVQNPGEIQDQWQIQDFPLGGHQPLTHTLFGKNVCENERNGSCWGVARAGSTPPPPDPPMKTKSKIKKKIQEKS